MVSGITDVSALQVLRATQAFKSAIKASPSCSEFIEDVDVKLSLSEESKQVANNIKTDSIKKEEALSSKNIDRVSEIREYANKYGINDISNDDIDYAMRYGRSILVDQVG